MFFLHRYRAFFVVFFTMLFISLGIVGAMMHYKLKSEARQMEYLAVTKSQEIIEAIYALLYKAEALSTLVIQGNGEIRDLSRIAPIIINSPVIRNVLLAPGGVVTQLYPENSNKGLLGFNMLGPGAGNEEARLAKDSKKLTLGGPFTAVQGGQVLVGRLPVFLDKDGASLFWGLVSVTLSYPEALAPVRLNEMSNMGFACEIWRINPDLEEKQIILRTGTEPLQVPLEKEFSLLNARWKISISPLSPWYQKFSFYALLGAALLFSALLAAIAQNYWEMRQIRASLEHMARYDTLTGLPNRRSAFEKLEKTLDVCRETNTSFALGYLDLNGFKNINDTHGHHVGDYVLKETTRRIVDCLPIDQFVGRIGGDEFILILTGHVVNNIPQLIENMNTSLAQPVCTRLADNLELSLSMGFAFYPQHGSTAEELTAYADAAMYTNKEEHRCKRRMASR